MAGEVAGDDAAGVGGPLMVHGADDNRLVPVLIAEDPPPASHDAITIISPRGFRVTVLGVDVAARLLAMLG